MTEELQTPIREEVLASTPPPFQLRLQPSQRENNDPKSSLESPTDEFWRKMGEDETDNEVDTAQTKLPTKQSETAAPPNVEPERKSEPVFEVELNKPEEDASPPTKKRRLARSDSDEEEFDELDEDGDSGATRVALVNSSTKKGVKSHSPRSPARSRSDSVDAVAPIPSEKRCIRCVKANQACTIGSGASCIRCRAMHQSCSLVAGRSDDAKPAGASSKSSKRREGSARAGPGRPSRAGGTTKMEPPGLRFNAHDRHRERSVRANGGQADPHLSSLDTHHSRMSEPLVETRLSRGRSVASAESEEGDDDEDDDGSDNDAEGSPVGPNGDGSYPMPTSSSSGMNPSGPNNDFGGAGATSTENTASAPDRPVSDHDLSEAIRIFEAGLDIPSLPLGSSRRTLRGGPKGVKRRFGSGSQPHVSSSQQTQTNHRKPGDKGGSSKGISGSSLAQNATSALSQLQKHRSSPAPARLVKALVMASRAGKLYSEAIEELSIYIQEQNYENH